MQFISLLFNDIKILRIEWVSLFAFMLEAKMHHSTETKLYCWNFPSQKKRKWLCKLLPLLIFVSSVITSERNIGRCLVSFLNIHLYLVACSYTIIFAHKLLQAIIHTSQPPQKMNFQGIPFNIVS